MRQPGKKEYFLPKAFAAGILILIAIQAVSALFMKEGVFTAAYHRVVAVKKAPTLSASATPEIVPEEDRSRRFAVMIDNHPNALPQSGLDKAAIIWEALVEGGLTRYMAVFASSSDVPEIGPVRSARPYFLDWAKEFDAAYVHVGGSDEALKLLAGPANLDNVDEFAYGSTFWRDAARSAPHNAYTSIPKLKALAEKKIWHLDSKTADTTLRSDAVSAGPAATTIDVSYARGGQQAEFRYDAATKTYRRYVNDRLVKTRDNAPLAPATLVEIELDSTPGKDPFDKGLQAMKTASGGKAVVFRNGVAIEGTWKKSAADAPMVIADAEGKKIAFAFGQVWYSVVAPNRGGSVVYR